MLSVISHLLPTHWGKAEHIVLLVLYASVILSCISLLALLVLAVIKLELQFDSVIAAILSGLMLSVAVSVAGLTLSSLTVYGHYKKLRAKKMVDALFLVVLFITGSAAFLFKAGFLSSQ